MPVRAGGRGVLRCAITDAIHEEIACVSGGICQLLLLLLVVWRVWAVVGHRILEGVGIIGGDERSRLGEAA